MRNGRILFCVFMISVAGFAIYQASGWSFKTALFPLAVSIPLLALLSVHLVQIIFGKAETASGAAVDITFSSDVAPEVERQRVIGTFIWIVGFIVSVYLIGFPLTVPLFIFTYLKFQSRVGWPTTIAATAITWASFYGLFQWLIRIQFEDGAIQAWLNL